MCEKLPSIIEFRNDVIFSTLNELALSLELKSKTLFYIMRIAISGLEVTPGGATELAEILGKDECLSRLVKALEIL